MKSSLKFVREVGVFSTHWVFNSTQIRGMMSKRFSFRKILNSFYCVLEQFPDKRTGDNTRYSMRDIALGAFSVFFTQNPSFLSHQTSLKMAKAGLTQKTGVVFKITNDFKELMPAFHRLLQHLLPEKAPR